MREPTTKDFAEYFRRALEAGLCREEEIEGWADTMLVETASPVPDWLLSLSTERATSKNRLLQAVPGDIDQITAWNLLLARLGIANRAKQLSREQIVRLLFRWAVSREIPKRFFRAAYTLDDMFDGIQSGYYSEEQFTKDFEDFFEQFRSFEGFLLQPNLHSLQ